MKDQVEKAIGIILYYHEGGLAPGEWEEVMGTKKTLWEDIPQWKHDDYYFQAEKVLEYLQSVGLIDAEKLKPKT